MSLVRASVCVRTSLRPMEGKKQVNDCTRGSRTYTPGLEEREVVCAVRSEEMDGGQDVPAQDPHLFPSPNGIHSVPNAF